MKTNLYNRWKLIMQEKGEVGFHWQVIVPNESQNINF